jgi:hypothetical protein
MSISASARERLETIEIFLGEADADFAIDRLLAELRTTVIPDLRCLPRNGPASSRASVSVRRSAGPTGKPER